MFFLLYVGFPIWVPLSSEDDEVGVPPAQRPGPANSEGMLWTPLADRCSSVFVGGVATGWRLSWDGLGWVFEFVDEVCADLCSLFLGGFGFGMVVLLMVVDLLGSSTVLLCWSWIGTASVHCWGWYAPVGKTLGNSWRIGPDDNNWPGVLKNIDIMNGLEKYAGSTSWPWVKKKSPRDHRFWSIFPFAKGLFWVPFFDPQPAEVGCCCCWLVSWI